MLAKLFNTANMSGDPINSNGTDPLFDALPYGLLQLDQEDRVVRWNQRLHHWTGLAPDAVRGHRLVEIYPEAPHLGPLLAGLRAHRQPRVWSQMLHRWLIPVRLPPGEPGDFTEMQQECHLRPLAEPAGHLVITILDVTTATAGQQRGRAQQTQLIAARDRAEHAFQELAGHEYAVDQHAIMALTDARGLITYVNDKFCKLSQYSREELIGHSHRVINSGHHPAEFFAGLWATISRGEVWCGEICNRAKDGSVYWVDTTLVPQGPADGRPARYVAIHTDITARKQSEAMLALQARLLEQTQACAQIGGWEYDCAENTLLWTDQTYRIHELSPLTHRPTVQAAIAFYAPASIPVITAAFNRGVEHGTPWDLELELITSTRRAIWVRATGKSERVNGRTVRIYGSFQDITERKQSEQALARERFLMQALMNHVPDFIYFKDCSGRLIKISKSKALVHGLADPAQAVGKTDFDFFPREHAKKAYEDEQAVIELGQPVAKEERLTLDGHPELWVSTTKVPLRDEDGNIVGTFGISRDITPAKEAERLLLLAKAEAELGNRAKAAFLSTMSHELRTPMNAVLGFSTLLLETTLDPEQRNYVETLSSSGEDLLRMLNDILEYSELESTQRAFAAAAFDVGVLVRELAAEYEPKARERGLSFKVEIAPGSSRQLHADKLRVRQVLGHLVGNALKFTPKGGITVQVSTLARGDESRLRISVADTGIGIARDQHSQLFQRFTQVDSSASRAYGGFGLGLAISKRLIDLLGGEIAFESEPGKGSIFWFTLPQSAAPGPAITQNTPLPGRGI